MSTNKRTGDEPLSDDLRSGSTAKRSRIDESPTLQQLDQPQILVQGHMSLNNSMRSPTNTNTKKSVEYSLALSSNPLLMAHICISSLKQRCVQYMDRQAISSSNMSFVPHHQNLAMNTGFLLKTAADLAALSSSTPISMHSAPGYVPLNNIDSIAAAQSKGLVPRPISNQGSQRYFVNYKTNVVGESMKFFKDPICLALPLDKYKLSDHQQFLRMQIEIFQATEDDVNTHTRGRNRRIHLRQVGIRCRHCAYLPASRREKGSVYFPASTLGIYQAAQNMSTAHIQCGLCPEMPNYIKEHFKVLIATKSFTTGAGRPYWATSAKNMGLVDTSIGIRFKDDIPEGTVVTL